MIDELDDDFIRWLAQYLVMKRVSIEQNFQPLYNLFLLAIENRKLEEFVKLETFRNIKVLFSVRTVKNYIKYSGLFVDFYQAYAGFFCT